MSINAENARRIKGSAVYEPDLGSFKRSGEKSSMEYHNIYHPNAHLLIEYDSAKGYIGKKIVNGKDAGMAFGAEWTVFFGHFTALGLAEGEPCLFEEL